MSDFNRVNDLGRELLKCVQAETKRHPRAPAAVSYEVMFFSAACLLRSVLSIAPNDPRRREIINEILDAAPGEHGPMFCAQRYGHWSR